MLELFSAEAMAPPPPPVPDDASAVMRTVFGHAGFRTGQGEAVAPCSAARRCHPVTHRCRKSPCYQVPAVTAFRRGLGTTIVVSLTR
jgi:superfamily II DNA helicase RecQ